MKERDWSAHTGCDTQSLMHSLTLKTLLNRVQPIKGFVYESARFSNVVANTIEVVVFPRLGSKAQCSGCGRRCPTYDHQSTRTWQMPPLWNLMVVLFYGMRRVSCPVCGVVVERVPWATGKHTLTDGFRLFLAHWARKLSWAEVAGSFHVAWADVYASVSWVVAYGLAHRNLTGIQTLGIDEVCVRVGRVFWTLIYQIDASMVRLLWIGHDRTEQTLRAGLGQLGPTVCAGIRYVCSDLWKPYLAAVREQLPHVLHILDRFHIRQQLNKAVDEVRKDEARALAQAGLEPRLKKLRWALLKKRQNWTPKERRRMRELKQTGLAALRAYWLVAAFEHFWGYVSPTWAGKFLDAWCQRARASRLAPLKRVASTLAASRGILLNYFRAKKAISGGIIEGLNNKVKLTFRKAYGFRTDKAREIALYHVLGKLPEPELAHRFF